MDVEVKKPNNRMMGNAEVYVEQYAAMSSNPLIIDQNHETYLTKSYILESWNKTFTYFLLSSSSTKS